MPDRPMRVKIEVTVSGVADLDQELTAAVAEALRGFDDPRWRVESVDVRAADLRATFWPFRDGGNR